jgi:hypothetical protein
VNRQSTADQQVGTVPHMRHMPEAEAANNGHSRAPAGDLAIPAACPMPPSSGNTPPPAREQRLTLMSAWPVS